MITYQYKCTVCGHQFERRESMRAKAVRKCEKCSGKAMRLITGGGGVIFKGTGFYCTDYKRGKKATDETT